MACSKHRAIRTMNRQRADFSERFATEALACGQIPREMRPLSGHARVDSVVASQAIPAFLPGAKERTRADGPLRTWPERLATI
jgi:hypothetical protein